MRVIIVGSAIFVKRDERFEFIRIRKNQKFNFKKTDIIICFDDTRNFDKGLVSLFSEREPREDFHFNIKSISSNKKNKQNILEYLSILAP